VKQEPVIKHPQPPAATEAQEPRWLGRSRPSDYAPYPEAASHRDRFQTTTEPDSIRPRRQAERPASPPPREPQAAPAQQQPQPGSRQGQANREESDDQRQNRRHGDRQQQDN
jgi:hypothetical protein